MTKFKFLAAAVLASVLALGMTGCKATPQQIAYRTAATTVVSVDLAMSEWGAYVGAVHPPVSQEAAVAAAYSKYQSAMAVACDAGAAYAAASATNSGGATGLSAALDQALTNLNQSITDLEGLITSFGLKLSNGTSSPAPQFAPIPVTTK